MAVVFRRADQGGGFEKGILFRAAGPAAPGERHLQVDRDELLLLGGVTAVGVGLLVLLRGQPRCPSGYALVKGECKPVTGPCPPHAAGPGEPYCSCLPGFEAVGQHCQPLCLAGQTRNAQGQCVLPPTSYPVVTMGSAWVRRAGWVRDHGPFGPLYGANGLLAGWIPFGTALQTTGPIAYIAVGNIASDGSSCCASGSNPMYPVQGGFVAPIDVVVNG